MTSRIGVSILSVLGLATTLWADSSKPEASPAPTPSSSAAQPLARGPGTSGGSTQPGSSVKPGGDSSGASGRSKHDTVVIGVDHPVTAPADNPSTKGGSTPPVGGSNVKKPLNGGSPKLGNGVKPGGDNSGASGRSKHDVIVIGPDHPVTAPADNPSTKGGSTPPAGGSNVKKPLNGGLPRLGNGVKPGGDSSGASGRSKHDAVVIGVDQSVKAPADNPSTKGGSTPSAGKIAAKKPANPPSVKSGRIPYPIVSPSPHASPGTHFPRPRPRPTPTPKP